MSNLLSEEAHQFARQFLMENEGVIQGTLDPQTGHIHIVAGAWKPGTDVAFPVYDDADSKNVWLPSTVSYDDWAKTLKGKPTLGYGMRYDLLQPDMREAYVKANGKVGMDWILRGLDSHINAIMEPVLKRHPDFTKLTASQQGALASFYYNLGPSPLNKETLEAAVHANDCAGIYKALVLYCKVGGKVVQGLLARRERERLPFAENANTNPPSAVAQANQSGVLYEIQAGDTLWSIWKKLSSSQEDWNAFQKRIAAANPSVDLEKGLKIGQKIKLA